MVHARHMDRRRSRQLQYQQTKNQELQKNMVALASQMKGLEEEAMKKLKVPQPYTSLPPPLVSPKTPSVSTEAAISAGASPKAEVKGEREGEGMEKVATGGKLLEYAEVGASGAAKLVTENSYGKSELHNKWCVDQNGHFPFD